MLWFLEAFSASENKKLGIYFILQNSQKDMGLNSFPVGFTRIKPARTDSPNDKKKKKGKKGQKKAKNPKSRF